MSFYGNVYYQFIDTFYKLIIYNHKKDETLFSFPNADEVKKETEIQAIGRTGTIDLNTGNKWIQFTIDPETQIVNLWHAKPENIEGHRAGLLYGIGYPARENDTSNKNHPFYDPNNKKTVVELEEGDYIWTSGVYYDEAGHIIHDGDSNGEHGKYQVCYKLPISTEKIDTVNLKKLVGMKDDGTSIEGDFTNTSVVKEILTNRSEISVNEGNITNNEKRIKALEDIYSNNDIFFDITDKINGSDYVLKEEDQVFPKNFGSISDIIAVWSNFINSNDYIKSYLKSDGILKQYFITEANGIIKIKDISTAICLITGTVTALKNNIESTVGEMVTDVNSAQTMADAAVRALGKNSSGGLPIFNDGATVIDALGRSDDKNIEACYFSKDNSVRKNIEDLNNNKVDNSTLKDYSTTEEINIILKDYSTTEKINNSLNSTLTNYSTTDQINTILTDYYTKTDINNIVGFVKDETSGEEKSVYAYIQSLENEINTLKTRVEALENPTPPDEGGEDNGNDEGGDNPTTPEDGE